MNSRGSAGLLRGGEGAAWPRGSRGMVAYFRPLAGCRSFGVNEESSGVRGALRRSPLRNESACIGDMRRLNDLVTERLMLMCRGSGLRRIAHGFARVSQGLTR